MFEFESESLTLTATYFIDSIRCSTILIWANIFICTIVLCSVLFGRYSSNVRVFHPDLPIRQAGEKNSDEKHKTMKEVKNINILFFVAFNGNVQHR